MKKLLLGLIVLIVLCSVSVMGVEYHQVLEDVEGYCVDTDRGYSHPLEISGEITCESWTGNKIEGIRDVCVTSDSNYLREWCLTKEECEKFSGEIGYATFFLENPNSFALSDEHVTLYFVDHECTYGCVDVSNDWETFPPSQYVAEHIAEQEGISAEKYDEYYGVGLNERGNKKHSAFCMSEEFARTDYSSKLSLEIIEEKVNLESKNCMDFEDPLFDDFLQSFFDFEYYGYPEWVKDIYYPDTTYATLIDGKNLKHWEDKCYVVEESRNNMYDNLLWKEGDSTNLEDLRTDGGIIESQYSFLGTDYITFREYFCEGDYYAENDKNVKLGYTAKEYTYDPENVDYAEYPPHCFACVNAPGPDYCLIDVEYVLMQEASKNKAITHETTAPTKPECRDGIDNDGDGTIDYDNGNGGWCDVDNDGEIESKAQSNYLQDGSYYNEKGMTKFECVNTYGANEEVETEAASWLPGWLTGNFFTFITGNAVDEDAGRPDTNHAAPPHRAADWYEADPGCISSSDDQESEIYEQDTEVAQAEKKKKRFFFF